MLSPALEKQRQQLYDRAMAAMEQRVQAAGDFPAMLAALRWGLDELERTYAETPARVKATVACRAGCAFCCSVPVHVQAHEVFFAAEHIRKNFPAAELAGVITRTAAHRTRLSGLYPDERGRLRTPCALLRDDRCSIYPGRPEACRAHHTNDVAPCRADLTEPDVAIEQAYIPALRARMFAVMLGLDAAIEAAGFDDRAYDFGSALHEALTNSLCQELWMRRKPAFPDACLAEPAGRDGLGGE